MRSDPATPDDASSHRQDPVTGRLPQRGGQCSTDVLWVSAALAAVGFSLANTVRGEAERTPPRSTASAATTSPPAGCERAAIELLWTAVYPNERALPKGTTVVIYDSPPAWRRGDHSGNRQARRQQSAPERSGSAARRACGDARPRIAARSTTGWRWRSRRAGSIRSSVRRSVFSGRRTRLFKRLRNCLLVRGVTPDLVLRNVCPGRTRATARTGGPRLVRARRPDGLPFRLRQQGPRRRQYRRARRACRARLARTRIQALVARRNSRAARRQQARRDACRSSAPRRHPLAGRQFYRDDPRHRPRSRLPNGQLSDLKRTVAAAGQVHAAGLRFPDPRSALVRHGLEQLTSHHAAPESTSPRTSESFWHSAPASGSRSARRTWKSWRRACARRRSTCWAAW